MSEEPQKKYTITKVKELPTIKMGSFYDKLLDEAIKQGKKGIFKIEVKGRKYNSVYGSLRTRIKRRKLENVTVCIRKRETYLIFK